MSGIFNCGSYGPSRPCSRSCYAVLAPLCVDLPAISQTRWMCPLFHSSWGLLYWLHFVCNGLQSLTLVTRLPLSLFRYSGLCPGIFRLWFISTCVRLSSRSSAVPVKLPRLRSPWSVVPLISYSFRLMVRVIPVSENLVAFDCSLSCHQG